jgi:hypothetical protein
LPDAPGCWRSAAAVARAPAGRLSVARLLAQYGPDAGLPTADLIGDCPQRIWFFYRQTLADRSVSRLSRRWLARWTGLLLRHPPTNSCYAAQNKV